MARALQRARAELGAAGLLAAGVIYFVLVLQPLEQRSAALEARLAARAPAAGREGASPAARLAGFYRFFETGETAPDWLARLHAAGAAAGVELHSAAYTLHKTGTRIERYEMVLPLTGSYPQIRAFLRSALAEIPVLSLDQVQIRREGGEREGRVRADARLTLHLVQP
ncbi:MAG TPA: GspMb/PilO family protein [Burkholderiales bacterium]|nr:GspMb/PilO family protein [Burkholderiales bacterium]